jgi:transposase
VLLMLDETIVTETPPLYGCYGRVGERVNIPVTGSHGRRILHGALNVRSGGVLLLVTKDWTQVEHRHFLNLIRAHWRGWNLVLFEDHASQHTCPGSRRMAAACGIEVRLLPKATPELNAMDHLWRHAKPDALANRPTETIEQSAQHLCQQILSMTPQQRLRQAGVLSGNFWLTT